ncbi:MAG: methyltransferase domain-containing protein [Verrucomicrobiota bacterium]
MAAIAKSLTRAYYIATDSVLGICTRLGIGSFGSGKRHQRYSAEKSADYAEWYVGLFEQLLSGPNAYRGDVCELGPGDSLAGGYLMRARGADSVTFFERFQSHHDREKELQVAQILKEREEKRTGKAALPSEAIATTYDAFRLVQGVPAEDHLRVDDSEYDLILSNSVLQHVLDPMPLLELCYERLRPGGRMLHVIDLRCLGLFKSWGELAWLQTSPACHRMMVQNTGRPNRIRFNQYREWAENSGAEYEFLIRHLVGTNKALGDIPPESVPEPAWNVARQLVESERPKFCPELRSISIDDHCVATFLLCITKPI